MQLKSKEEGRGKEEVSICLAPEASQLRQVIKVTEQDKDIMLSLSSPHPSTSVSAFSRRLSPTEASACVSDRYPNSAATLWRQQKQLERIFFQ